jgi:transposase
MPSPLSLSNLTSRLSRSLSTLQILPRRITSNKSLKNRKATKIQRTYRAYATRRKLEAEKLEAQAVHLFCKSKAARVQAAKELDDMARDVDEDNINTIAHHLWHELSNKKRAKWIDEAKNKMMQQSKSAPINPVVE